MDEKYNQTKIPCCNTRSVLSDNDHVSHLLCSNRQICQTLNIISDHQRKYQVCLIVWDFSFSTLINAFWGVESRQISSRSIETPPSMQEFILINSNFSIPCCWENCKCCHLLLLKCSAQTDAYLGKHLRSFSGMKKKISALKQISNIINRSL